MIGSGIAGLTASYVLAKNDRVTLYEKDSRLGGHAHTHDIELAHGRRVNVDSGFIVHNDRTYPTLTRLFGELGVQTRETDMSMSVRADSVGLQYAGAKGFAGLFPTARMLAKPRYLRLLSEIPRFHRAARELLLHADSEVTLGEFLTEHRFGRFFTDYFMTPLVAAVWSCDPGAATRYPARYLFQFLDHHGMLTVFDSPIWRTVVGGSARYVDRVAATLDEIRTGTEVLTVRERRDHVLITTAHETRSYDAAVIATHPQQALDIIAEPTSLTRAVLGAMPYTVSTAQLHTDESLLPRSHRARASWNYFVSPPDTEGGGVIVTYDLTRLMGLHHIADRRFLVTLGGSHLVAPDRVLAEMTYEHPVYTLDSVAAQNLLPELDSDRVSFAGAYHGWGFHEDGARSGLRAAERIGGRWPGSVAGSTAVTPVAS